MRGDEKKFWSGSNFLFLVVGFCILDSMKRPRDSAGRNQMYRKGTVLGIVYVSLFYMCNEDVSCIGKS